MSADEATSESARRAEQLSLQYEERRLASLGIDRKPQWVAIEDNTVGYEVLSYDPGEVPIARLIRVKLTIISPLRFLLTRSEWEQAAKLGQNYYFHVWDLNSDSERLFERNIAEIAPQIPCDNGQGRWLDVEICL